MTVALKSRKATKAVEIVSRVSPKNNPAYVVYTVRSSNGVDTYHTTLVDGHATGCDCAARSACRHMTACTANESTRATDLQQHIEDSAVSLEPALTIILGGSRPAYAMVQANGREYNVSMSQLNDQFPNHVVVSFDEYEAAKLNSCVCCGSLIKKAVICGKCLGC